MQKRTLFVSYKRPQNVFEGVRLQMRRVRTHLGEDFEIKFVANDEPSQATTEQGLEPLPLELVSRVVELTIEREPTRENAIELIGLYSRTVRVGSGLELIADIIRDASGSLEARITRRFFGGRTHERNRYQRRLGRTNVSKTYAWLIGPNFLNLSSDQIANLQAKADANDKVNRRLRNLKTLRERRPADIPDFSLESVYSGIEVGGITYWMDPWPWWYFRFVSNWKIRQDIVDVTKFLHIKRVTTATDVSLSRATTMIPSPGAPTDSAIWGADFILVDVDEMARKAAELLTSGDIDKTIEIVLRFHEKLQWRQEFDLSGISEAQDITEEKGIGLGFSRISLSSMFLRSSFVRNVLESASSIIEDIKLVGCDVSGEKLDLSTLWTNELHLSDVNISSLRLPCRKRPMAGLRELYLSNKRNRPIWRPFHNIKKDCLSFVWKLVILGGVELDHDFIRVLSEMRDLEDLMIQDSPIEWRSIVDVVNKTSKSRVRLSVAFLYRETDSPFRSGSVMKVGNVEVRFEDMKKEKIIIPRSHQERPS